MKQLLPVALASVLATSQFAGGAVLTSVVPFDFSFAAPVEGPVVEYPLSFVSFLQFDPALGTLNDAILTLDVTQKSASVELSGPVDPFPTQTVGWESPVAPPSDVPPIWVRTGGTVTPVSATAVGVPSTASDAIPAAESATYSPMLLSELIGTGSFLLAGVPDLHFLVDPDFAGDEGSPRVVFVSRELTGTAQLVYEYTLVPEPGTLALILSWAALLPCCIARLRRARGRHQRMG